MHNKVSFNYTNSSATAYAPAAIPAYLDVHPLHDYEPIRREEGTWIGWRRDTLIPRLVAVQKIQQVDLNDIRVLAQISHPNISRPISLYIVGQEVYLVYDFVDLDIFELPLLSLIEVENLVFQVLAIPTDNIS